MLSGGGGGGEEGTAARNHELWLMRDQWFLAACGPLWKLQGVCEVKPGFLRPRCYLRTWFTMTFALTALRRVAGGSASAQILTSAVTTLFAVRRARPRGQTR